MATPHRATLEHLVRHWRRIAAEESSNKMHAKNIAIVVFMVLTNLDGKNLSPMDLMQMMNPILCIIQSPNIFQGPSPDSIDEAAIEELKLALYEAEQAGAPQEELEQRRGQLAELIQHWVATARPVYNTCLMAVPPPADQSALDTTVAAARERDCIARKGQDSRDEAARKRQREAQMMAQYRNAVAQEQQRAAQQAKRFLDEAQRTAAHRDAERMEAEHVDLGSRVQSCRATIAEEFAATLKAEQMERLAAQRQHALSSRIDAIDKLQITKATEPIRASMEAAHMNEQLRRIAALKDSWELAA